MALALVKNPHTNDLCQCVPCFELSYTVHSRFLLNSSPTQKSTLLNEIKNTLLIQTVNLMAPPSTLNDPSMPLNDTSEVLNYT